MSKNVLTNIRGDDQGLDFLGVSSEFGGMISDEDFI